jgi:endo-1,4-beta-xylanase
MRCSSLLIPVSAWLLLCAACAGSDNSEGTGGAAGGVGKGGTAAAGANGSGGSPSGGGGSSSGASTGGSVTNTGGTSGSGGQSGGTGGFQNGGATGGTVAGGGSNTGGTPNGGAGAGSGGAPSQPDCNAAMPSSGAVQHSGNGVGGQGNLGWEIWSNTGQGELTSYSVPAFTATWNNAGGYLGRLGYEWGGFGSTPKPYEQHGTISAQFVAKKSGTAGGYSYIGMYGWSTSPCVEWYVVDDSFNNMPINPGMTTNEGEVEIDGGSYIMYTRPTTGSGGTRCSNTTEWIQYYSVRKTARQCGVISLTKHFEAWKGLGMSLGNLLEAKILVEVGGGVGKVDLPVANVMEAQ